MSITFYEFFGRLQVNVSFQKIT